MRFYRALLHLYPAGFRAEYGEELLAAHAARVREHAGPLAPLTHAALAIADVVPNAIAAHADILRQDLRYASRSLGRAPGFALTAVLVVALGVGANTAAFSLADFVLLRPLPFPEPDRLVRLWQTTPGYGQLEFSPPNYHDLKSMSSSFSAMGAYSDRAANLTGSGAPRRLALATMTPSLMELLGVEPARGRLITPEDSAVGTTVLLSHALWGEQFGGDPGIVGRVVRLDGVPHTVIGVMPASFRFPARDVALWTPHSDTPGDLMDRSNNYLKVVARLAPGVTLEAALAEVQTIAARLVEQHPEANRETSATLYRMQDGISTRSRTLVLALCGAALCILLLACANLASLLLARGVSRARELAVRTALGAGRERLVRQLVTESVALAAVGGVLGILLAAACMPLLAQLVPGSLPIGEHPTLDRRVLAFAAVLVAVTGLAFGILPAMRAGGSRAMDALRDGARAAGGRRQRVRSALVVLEVSGSIVLLVAAGLLMRAIMRLESVEPGFRTEGVTTLRTALPLPRYAAVPAREVFHRRVLEEVRALPGVESAAYVTGLPMAMGGGIWGVTPGGIGGVRTGQNTASLRFATPGFFETLGIPIKRGRDVSDRDTRDRPFVAVVSESLAEREWPGQDPIGRTFGFAFHDRTVVGVVGDVRVRGLEQSSEPQVYLPAGQVEDNSLIGYIPKELVIRSTLPAETFLPRVRAIIAAVDPEQPISDVRPLSEVVVGETAPRRVQLRLLAVLSGLALLIAGVGLHGLLSFAVSQRTQELGIRRALGAPAGTIVGMVMREGLLLAAIGAAVGVGVGLLVGRGMSALLFGVPPHDPVAFGVAVALCLVVALAGCVRPALRAAGVDPMMAMREG